MDEWAWMFIDMILHGTTQTCKAETKSGNSKTQDFCSDVPKGEKEFIYGIGPNSIPYEKVLKVTTYTEIQEGEFEEIEDAESGETSIRELADQAADRGEEVLRDEADEGRVQGGSEETVCWLRDREEEPDDSGGSD